VAQSGQQHYQLVHAVKHQPNFTQTIAIQKVKFGLSNYQAANMLLILV
jgi:hypothetical protein